MKMILLIILFLFNCSGPYDNCVKENQKKNLGYLSAAINCSGTNANRNQCDLSLVNIAVNTIFYPSYCDGSEK
ncbi:MAG: hypothetical protein SFU98_21085 [Leptospiraceae bacterium]|nr:hypothetical protein [Leptospiraceae bacterium]